MRKLKILLLFDSPYAKPRGYDFKEEFKDIDWATEGDVLQALRKRGHEVNILGLYKDINLLLEEVRENKPDVIFNLVEVFDQKSSLDKNVVYLLELLGVPFTGADPASLLVCNNKALSKKILSFHRIKVPHFYTFYKKHKIWLPKKLNPPLIVKPLCEEASRGIAQASIVDSEETLVERVKFIHQSLDMDAIAEEYIDGREFYVSILGNKRIKVLPLREMKFGQFPEDEPRIATYKAKWDYNYRQKWGIKNVFAGRLANGLEAKISYICKRAYRAIDMKCYARFDIRVTGGEVYIIEANANPSLFMYDEVAQSADKAGISYDKLLEMIISFAFQRQK
ncbi:MAG: ATP-grasp domain-containing protein [Candidatus Omnitrophica bacterium]|nr:ATP-grasp domain-containing protein [Candidatus Omnitrophota bacterium]